VRSFFLNTAVVLCGSLLFALSFPNPLFYNGLGFCAFFALAPVVFVICRNGIVSCIAWGGLYGYVSYLLFNHWLVSFHPLAGFFAGGIFFFYLSVLFPLMKLAHLGFPKRGFILMTLIFLAYEYVRTLGFLGYSYGILAYTQWRFIPLIQIASLCGVWGVSALAAFPGVLTGWVLARVKDGTWKTGVKYAAAPAMVFCVVFAAALVYGAAVEGAYRAEFPSAKIALIQPNNDPWKGGIYEYRKNFAALTELSDAALRAEPAADLVVWPETAFIPRVYWYLTYREGNYYPLVKELVDYLAAKETAFVIGNDDGRREVGANGVWEDVDYNAALFFEKGDISGVYRKTHLVPFAEYFPYTGGPLGMVRRALEEDTHFWKPGTTPVVFELARADGPLKFSTPICFEDTFGYLSRDFTRGGAQLIVNLSNDAWSASLSCQMQHLATAVFRAVENRRSLVRATTTGQSCAIDPLGRVIAKAEPFTETFLTVEVPLVDSQSPYTRLGDVLGQGFALAALAGLAAAILHIPGQRSILTKDEHAKKNTRH
jgi:apolipoprotein N-acyltransferase